MNCSLILFNVYVIIKFYLKSRSVTFELISFFLCLTKVIINYDYYIIDSKIILLLTNELFFESYFITFTLFYYEIMIYSFMNYIISKGYFFLQKESIDERYYFYFLLLLYVFISTRIINIVFGLFLIFITVIFLLGAFGVPSMFCEETFRTIINQTENNSLISYYRISLDYFNFSKFVFGCN